MRPFHKVHGSKFKCVRGGQSNRYVLTDGRLSDTAGLPVSFCRVRNISLGGYVGFTHTSYRRSDQKDVTNGGIDPMTLISIIVV